MADSGADREDCVQQHQQQQELQESQQHLHPTLQQQKCDVASHESPAGPPQPSLSSTDKIVQPEISPKGSTDDPGEGKSESTTDASVASDITSTPAAASVVDRTSDPVASQASPESEMRSEVANSLNKVLDVVNERNGTMEKEKDEEVRTGEEDDRSSKGSAGITHIDSSSLNKTLDDTSLVPKPEPEDKRQDIVTPAPVNKTSTAGAGDHHVKPDALPSITVPVSISSSSSTLSPLKSSSSTLTPSSSTSPSLSTTTTLNAPPNLPNGTLTGPGPPPVIVTGPAVVTPPAGAIVKVPLIERSNILSAATSASTSSSSGISGSAMQSVPSIASSSSSSPFASSSSSSTPSQSVTSGNITLQPQSSGPVQSIATNGPVMKPILAAQLPVAGPVTATPPSAVASPIVTPAVAAAAIVNKNQPQQQPATLHAGQLHAGATAVSQPQTVIITTPDGQQKMVSIQPSNIVPGTSNLVHTSPGGPRFGATTAGSSTAVTGGNNNVISSGTATVLLSGKPVQSNANVQSAPHLNTTVVTGQQQQSQQQQSAPHPHPQQVLVSNPQMHPQMVQVRLPNGQIQQIPLNPQQLQGIQRQLAPRPNQQPLVNGPLRLQQNLRSPIQPGMIMRPGSQFLIRTEHGLQLVNIAPQPGLQAGQPATIRFPVPVSTGAAGQVQQQMGQVRQQIVNIQSPIRTQIPQQQQPQQQPQQQSQQQTLQSTPVNQQLSIQTQQANSQAAAAQSQSQMSPTTAKRKCKNFLSTLIRLANDQPEHVAQNVRKLIQGLIDGVIIPEDFTNQLQRELNSSPQPCLIPFLKKSLPHLKQSLMVGEMTIEGVNPPPRNALPPQMPVQFQRPGIRFLATFPPAPMVHPAQGMQTPMQRLPQPHTAATASSLSAPSVSTPATAATTPSPAPPPSAPAKKSKAKPRATSATKDKEKKVSTSLREDDDINDVAAMGGVNLAEENQRMAAAANEVGTQIRSCKDENFFLTNILANKVSRIASKFSLEEPAPEVISLISHAAQERIKTLVERLGIVAEHRLEVFRVDPKYEVAQDVRAQIKFLEELDKMEKRRHEEQEREMLLKAAKSRSKLEDPEQLKLKQKAKEMQRAELEEARQREANETALLAIGPRKKLKLDNSPASASTSASPAAASSSSASAAAGTNSTSPFLNNNPINNNVFSNSHNSLFSSTFGSSKAPMRRLTKRVTLKDLLFVMETDRSTSKSSLLYRSYAK